MLHRVFKAIFICNILVLFNLSYILGKDLPEQVEDYVNTAIYQSQQIAKNHADLSEKGIILDRVSEMQSYLAMISADQAIFQEAAKALRSMKSLVVDVSSIEKIELEKAFKISMLLTQMNSAYEHMDSKIQKFNELNVTFPDVCAKQFESYDTKNLGFNFNEQYSVNYQIYLDLSVAAIYGLNELSVHLLGEKLISSSGKIFGASAPVVIFIWTVIKSGYDIITAEIDRNKIQSHVERLKREIVKNVEYQQYAKISCIKYRDQEQKTVKLYADLKDTISSNFKSYRPKRQREQVDALISYILNFDQKVLNAIKERVRTWAEVAFGESRKDDSYKESMSLNLKRLQLLRLECGEGFANVQWIREKIVQNQVLNLDISEEIIRKCNQSLMERFTACPIEAI